MKIHSDDLLALDDCPLFLHRQYMREAINTEIFFVTLYKVGESIFALDPIRGFRREPYPVPLAISDHHNRVIANGTAQHRPAREQTAPTTCFSSDQGAPPRSFSSARFTISRTRGVTP